MKGVNTSDSIHLDATYDALHNLRALTTSAPRNAVLRLSPFHYLFIYLF